MSDVGDIGEEAIGAVTFTRSHGAGFAEACRLYLSRRGITEHELPLFYCRLSEALLHRGSHEDASRSHGDAPRPSADGIPAVARMPPRLRRVGRNC